MSDRKKLYLAIAASLLLHLLGFLFLVLWTTFHKDTFEPSELPHRRQIEVTVMRRPPAKPPEKQPVAVANPMPVPKKIERRTLDTEGLQSSEKPPEKAEFESDKHSRAASEQPATGNAPLPSQQGRESRNVMEFKSQNYSLGKAGQPGVSKSEPVTVVKPQPGSIPVPRETPSPAQQMAKLSDNLFALQRPTPAGRPKQPASTPVPPKPVPVSQPKPAPAGGYQAQKVQTRIEGNISNRGRAGVNALGTPLGRYQKIVGDAVGSRWYYYVNKRMDLLTIGEARIRFCVNSRGGVEDIEILSNTSNEVFGNYCIQSITKAELPPIPPDLGSLLDDGRLEIEFSFTIYPN